MKKLGICCNFGPPHIGGSEQVLENVASQLVEKYNYEITIYGCNYKTAAKYKNFHIIPCQRGERFIPQIAQNDHIFIYSDSFWEFDTLVENIDKIDCKVSLCLVGAYHMQSHPETLDLVKKSQNRLNFICHSRGQDYDWCLKNGIKAKVIPNGVNLVEFEENAINFREKYNIKEKYILLNVSNFFYGKGQEILSLISRRLSEELDDFVILSISNSVEYPYEKRFLQQCERNSKGTNVRFIRNIPREDVVAAFKASDVFLFTSKKEVAPIVLLESKAAGIPYISMVVGNVEEVKGGIPILYGKKDDKGYAVVEEKVINHYVVGICHYFTFPRIQAAVMKEVREGVEDIDWKNIVPLYDEVFGE